MRVFHCDHCHQLIFFENTLCGNCGHKLAYLPDLRIVASLDSAGAPSSAGGSDLWTSPVERARGKTYRLCANYANHYSCNCGVLADDPQALCQFCRFTRFIPDLSLPENQEKWSRLEVAKRRLIYTLVELNLPLCTKAEDPDHGLQFNFIGDMEGSPRVLTGHDAGVITMNICEADDVERERARVAMHEPYRTLLGHFRHEIGHYYWDRLIKDTPRLEAFRDMFGDERTDYNQALAKNYAEGPRPDWQKHFVSSYAGVHSWEDWAETWAHYMHMFDALETAKAAGLSLHPDRPDEPKLDRLGTVENLAFDEIIREWFPLTYILNSLNRSMGIRDAYPFVLSNQVVEKLRFVHETIYEDGKNIKNGEPACAHAR